MIRARSRRLSGRWARAALVGVVLGAALATVPSSAAAREMLIYGERGFVPDGAAVALNKWSEFGDSDAAIYVDPNNTTPVYQAEGIKFFYTRVNGAWGGWGLFHAAGQNYAAYNGGFIRVWTNSYVYLKLEIQSTVYGKAAVTLPQTGGYWVEYTIPISYFRLVSNNQPPPAGFLNSINAPFLITSENHSNPAIWYVDHARITTVIDGLSIFPPNVTAAPGSRRLFTVEGYRAGQKISVYGAFSAPGSVGTMSPAAPSVNQASLLTAAGSSGLVTVTHQNWAEGPYTANASVTAGGPTTQVTGFISETLAGPTIGVDTDFRSFRARTDPEPVIETVADFVPEGNTAIRTTVNVPPPPVGQGDGFAGWALQVGLGASPDTVTRDMSLYYDGSIRFWFKGPLALKNKLVVSIRSGNVPAGTEYSKQLLNRYVDFDNNNNVWVPATIPLADLASVPPWADLSRMKNLFTIYAVGDTGGNQVFWVDNVRWDQRIPGAPTAITLAPANVTLPTSARQVLLARMTDALGVSVDGTPSWTINGGVASITAAAGPKIAVMTAGSNASGSIVATINGRSATAVTTIAPTNTGEGTKPIYRDAGLYTRLDLNWFSDVFKWSQVTDATTVADVTDASAPEGLERIDTTISTRWGGWGVFNILPKVNQNDPSVATSRDFRPFANGALRFWLKSNLPLVVGVEFDSLELGRPDTRELSVASTGNQWQEMILPLSSFPAGIEWSTIRSMFKITATQDTAPPKTWSVDDVRWTKPVASVVVFPEAGVTVNPGRQRLITVEGRTPFNEVVDVYGGFGTSGGVGTISPAVGRAGVLTAGGAPATGTVGAASDSRAGSRSAAVVTTSLDSVFGVVSETRAGTLLDRDSGVFVDTGGVANTLSLVSDAAEKREGGVSLRATVNLTGSQYAGWGVIWATGTAPIDLAASRDMSAFYNGSIRFWYRGPVAIKDLIRIGIRSTNVPSGTELSQVLLRDYANLAANDNQWVPVAIPLTAFAKAPPWADISRTKILFSVYVIGATGGARQFWIDDVRWDTRTPGALASITVTPASVNLPLGTQRNFIAKGWDGPNGTGAEVDIYPTWTVAPVSLGTLASSQGTSVRFTAAGTPGAGTVTATFGGRSGAANVTVANVSFTECTNIYSEIGAGGRIGISSGVAAGTFISLAEQPSGGREGSKYMRATYSLINRPGMQDAYAVWFTEEENGSRFLGPYANGFMHFWVRTNTDLQVSIRSENIEPGTEKSKFRLSELGVPANGDWQEVWLSLADFKTVNDAVPGQPPLDFTRMSNFFTIGAQSVQVGEVLNRTFDVDDVRWCTADPTVPNPSLVLEGLRVKQTGAGLVQTFDNDAGRRAVTYDQALAAMAFSYAGDLTRARAIFDVYRSKYEPGFAGFHEEYDALTPATIRDYDRTTGPNAFMLLALVHYRNVTGDNRYDAMSGGIADWLRTLQDPDGGLRFGYTGVGGTPANWKSTEQNFDAYAALRAWAQVTGSAVTTAAANAIYTWLTTEMYTGSRFNLGESAGGVADPDKALDTYSWAPLALSSFSAVVNLAETEFGVTKMNGTTGLDVQGFDFYPFTLGAPLKDAVWLEGTAHMVVAYYDIGRRDKALFYLNELRKAVYRNTATTQALAYATNGGTAYGFDMDATHAATSSMAWFLFANWNFNPFRPFPLHRVTVKNLSNNQPASTIGWTVSAPAGWVRANQYLEFVSQPIALGNQRIVIFTDNTNRGYTPPWFEDPTPTRTTNRDSDPAGLLAVLPDATTTYHRLPLAWSVKESTDAVSAPVATEPYRIGMPNPPAASYQWAYVKDRATPAIDANNDGDTIDETDGTAFSFTETYVTVRLRHDIHSAQGEAGFNPSLSPDVIYLQANFGPAGAQILYRTRVFLQAYNE